MAIEIAAMRGDLSEHVVNCVSGCSERALDEPTTITAYLAAHAAAGNIDCVAGYICCGRKSGLKDEQIARALCIAACCGGQKVAYLVCAAFDAANREQRCVA